LETLTGEKVDCIHVVGGGAKNALLCQYTADATNLPVHAGPSEATSIGNVISQAISSGIIKDITEGRNIVKTSFPPVIYQPENPEEWDELYINNYTELLDKNKK
jgi:rhamnulokinase